MSHPLIVRNSIFLHAPAAKVWDALVNPAQTKKYMFGCEALSDWKVGSPLIWRGNFDGVELIAVSGNIVEFRPDERLVYTTIDPNSPIPDVPENYLTVTCELAEEKNGTRLTISQGDYASVADGHNRYEHTVKGGGWEPILAAIQQLVEAK